MPVKVDLYRVTRSNALPDYRARSGWPRSTRREGIVRKLVMPGAALVGAVLAAVGGTVTVSAVGASPAATFRRSPAAGPPGSLVTVASITPCPATGGATNPVVDAGLVQGDRLVSDALLPISASGRWQGSLQIPRSATPGPATLQAACLTKPPSGPPEGLSALKTLTYDNRSFTVTARPSVRRAAPARPVPAVPATTG